MRCSCNHTCKTLPALAAGLPILAGNPQGPKLELKSSQVSSRHPLLYGDYLVAKERQRRAPQRAAPDAGPLRRLGNRKDVMARLHGTLKSEDAPAPEAAGARGEPPAEPPVAIDVRVRPETRCVIITGPNTGGKTATIKVAPAACFGLEPGMRLSLVPCSPSGAAAQKATS